MDGKRIRKQQMTTLIIVFVAIFTISIGFAAFSSNLSIKSNVSVNPDSSKFGVIFSNDGNNTDTNQTVAASEETYGDPATITNGSSPSIGGLKAKFTAPGQSVSYTFYSKNTGSYDAYLNYISFSTAPNSSSNKSCVAQEGTSQEMVDAACEGISINIKVGNDEPVSASQSGITGHLLQKGYNEEVVVTITYEENSSRADGAFDVTFGDIMLIYSTISDGSEIVSTDGALQSKFDNAEDGSVLVLDMDYREQIVVPYGKTLTLDLNGYNVYGPLLKESWVGTISNYGTLTIIGDGVVTETAGGYVVLNHGTMVIEGGTYQTSEENSASAVIENGYRDPSKYKEGEESEFPHLTMNGGTVIGGSSNIKNDSNGTLVVNNATFTNDTSVNILNWNTAEINGGTFTVTDGKKTNINNAPGGTSTVDSGLVTINGGQFNSDYIVMGLVDEAFIRFNNGTYTGEIINPNNVTENYICTAVTEATTGNVPSGNYDIGDEYTCTVGNQTATENLKFFVLDKQGDNIYLIMDRNISKNHMPENVAWITKEHFLEAGGSEDVWTSNGNITQYGPISAMASLKEKTVQWNKIVEENIVLPTKDQIYNVNNSTSLLDSTWLWDHLQGAPNEPYLGWGYWTSDRANTVNAWRVSGSNLSGTGFNASRTDSVGIRPVIILNPHHFKN